jgi:hypothetical protein
MRQAGQYDQKKVNSDALKIADDSIVRLRIFCYTTDE